MEQYIRTGEPVGSKVLVSSLDFPVSSATVRSEMSELCEMGLLEQTHTSSGRVPTNRGYRYYVDELMKERIIDEGHRRRIDMIMSCHFNDSQELLEQAGEILADITKCAVVSATPSDASALIKKVELVPIGRRTGVVAMLTSTGVLKSCVCRTDTELTEETVRMFCSLASENFEGRSVAEVSTVMIQSLVVSFGENSLAMSPIIIAVADLAKEVAQSEIILEGQHNLMGTGCFQNIYEIENLFKRSDVMAGLLPEGQKTVSVFIGSENPYSQLCNSSVILSRYNVRGSDSGALGVIGSTRMDYAAFLPSIKYLTKIVGDMFSNTLEE